MKLLWYFICVVTFSDLIQASVNLEPAVKTNRDFKLLDENYELSEIFKEMMVNFKDVMKSGNDEYNLPILDPINIDKTFNIDDPSIKLKGEFQAEIHNLSNYVINKLYADMDLNIVANVTLYDVSMTGHYSFDGTAYGVIPLMGNGEHYLNFESFSLILKPTFDVKDGYMKLISTGLAYEEKAFEIFIEGLFEGADVSKLLSYLVRDTILSILNHNSQLTRLIDSSLINSFNEDGKGKNVYTLIENVKSLAGY